MHVAVSILTRPEGRVQLACPYCGSHLICYVSILTRPEGRVQPERAGDVEMPIIRVSILTRPEGRVQRRQIARLPGYRMFQSSPVPKDGCNTEVKLDGVA